MRECYILYTHGLICMRLCVWKRQSQVDPETERERRESAAARAGNSPND